ncbi:MAG: right-handed parallel beta-helix repeat-containing protein, partial [Thermoplasmata archaeon]|nr:right-handed parallel beta-helix repeat-containing protein [Thermoplasmata archaeon]
MGDQIIPRYCNTIQTPSPVYLVDSGYATISENTLTVPWYGGNCISISTNNGKKITITGNTLTGYCGIVANSMTNSEFVGNTIASGQYGIFLGASQRNNVSNNTIMPQSSTAGPYGMYLTGSHNNTVSNNSFVPNPLFAGSHIGFGITFESCNTNEVRGNTLRNCSGSAIYVSGGSQLNTLSLNTITGSMRGFYVSNGPTQNNMSSNSISGSTDGGFVIQNAISNTIYGNSIESGNYGLELIDSVSSTTCSENKVLDNNYGVWIRYSAGNFIYHNDFVSNIQQISQWSGDLSLNTWNDVYPLGGNYWSNYAGVDVMKGSTQTVPGADGIGDTPYG